MHKPAETRVPIHPILRDRWSPKAYSSRPVEQEKLISLFEAARWAPSGRNAQPWRFLVATKADPDAYDKMLSVFKERNRMWAKNAYVLMITATHTPSSRNAQHDLGQAVAHLSAQATSLGLSLRQVGGIDRDRAREIYHVPNDFEVMNGIALGYADEPDSLPEDMRDKERGGRSRNPLESFVFSEWEQPSVILQAEREAAVAK